VPGELPLALAGHYLIGITLTLTYAVLVVAARIAPGKAAIGAAVGFGLLSNLLPWLWMFPSMGFGLLGRTAPPEWLLFRSSLVAHVFFGVGLALFTHITGAFRS
jgi:hypothetical protein